MTAGVEVEVLVVPRCPHRAAAAAIVRDVLDEFHLPESSPTDLAAASGAAAGIGSDVAHRPYSSRHCAPNHLSVYVDNGLVSVQTDRHE